jgi:hypothetical protein
MTKVIREGVSCNLPHPCVGMVGGDAFASEVRCLFEDFQEGFLKHIICIHPIKTLSYEEPSELLSFIHVKPAKSKRLPISARGKLLDQLLFVHSIVF